MVLQMPSWEEGLEQFYRNKKSLAKFMLMTFCLPLRGFMVL